MHVLSYSKQLEYSASCWARQCKASRSRCRKVEDGLVGETICHVTIREVFDSQVGAITTSSMESCLEQTVSKFQINFTENLIDSIKYPRGGDDEMNRGAVQMIWAKTRYIGCHRIKYKYPQPEPLFNEVYMVILHVCHFFPASEDEKTIFMIGIPARTCDHNEAPNSQYPSLCGVIRDLADDPWDGNSNRNTWNVILNSILLYILYIFG
ncbi:hypothetical protein QE152_g14364 [Popillia japonica]|uniref:SCP domain-containing protein n=1 Tax=Popillia japonica TaxID=7064 RepID=A0AAW1L9T4_POPJA